MKKILSFLAAAFLLCSSAFADITVKAKVPSAWGSTITVWVWADGVNGAEYATTKDGDWFVYTNTSLSKFNIIFKNGAGWTGDANQTVDIMSVTANTCYQIGSNSGKRTVQTTNCDDETGGGEGGGESIDDPVVETQTIYFVNVLEWATVNAYVYGDAGQYLAWSGEAATKTELKANEKDVYSYTFPASYTTIIFNNGNGGEGNQTANLTWDATKPYYYNDIAYASIEEIPAGGADPGVDPVVENMTIYFVNVPEWTTVNAYVYGDAGQYLAWSGEAATKTELKANEKDVYSYTFPASYTTIIFNNGNGGEGNQTGNLTWDATKPYYYNDIAYASIEEIPAGGADPGEDPVVETQTIYFVNTLDWAAVNAYVYGDAGQYLAWSGEAATKTELKANEKDVYSYTFPASYTTIIFNNGNSGEGNQTANLTWDATKPYYYNDIAYASIEEIPTGGDEPQACNWDDIEFLGSTDPAYANQFKLCKEGEYPGVVNIQSSFGTEIGIYVTFPSAAFGAISLPEGKYATQGAGMLLYLSAFSAQETAVSVVCQEVEYSFVVYNAAGEAGQQDDHTYTVAGNPASVFVEAWKPELADNDMVKQEDGTYKWEKENLALSLGTVEFKVCVDHTWAESYPANNYEVSIASSGDYTLTITFNPETKDVHAEAVKTGGEGGDEPIENVTIYFVNSYNYEPVNAYVFNESGYKAWPGEAMTKLDEKVYGMDVYSYTFPNVFNQIIFNDFVGDNGNQTADLEWDADKPYYCNGLWYASLADIPAPGDKTVAVMGSMNEWSAAIPFTLSEDKESASLFVEDMDEDTYEFKMVIDGDWRSNGWTYHREFTGASGITENSDDNMILITDVRGSYKITWTFANDSLGFEFPAAPAPAKYYITGDSALVKDAADLGKDKAWAPKAIRATTDTTILNLKADVEYKLKITLDGDWNTGRGKSSLSEVTEGITTDGDDNIIFTLAEAGEVKVIYFVEGEVTTYKVLGNFKTEGQGGDEPQVCNWDDIEFLGSTDPAYANQFKLCKEGEYPGVVNIQASFGTEIGIYVTFPSAAFGAISLPEGKYATQGSGMLLYLSAFTAQETPVSVVCQEVEYSFVIYNAAAEVPQPGEHTYTVAGSATEVFGEAWNPALTENDMIKLADDTYAWKKENITLPAGVVQFKVVEDHDWDVSYPAENYSLNIPESGIYVINITFNAESHEITAEATKSGEAVVMPTIQLGGEMTEWATNAVTLTPAQDNLTASVTVALEAQNYLFKIISGGTWLTKLGESGNYTLHRDLTTADHVNVDVYGNDLLLQADVAGDYTFTWTYADSTLVITFPAAAGCNWDDIEFLGSTDPAYANQFKLCKEGEYPGVVNIQASFGTEIGIYVTFPSAAFGAISLPEGKYATQGSGMLLYLSAFTAQETPVSVVCQEVEYSFVVYNAAADAPQPEQTYYLVGSMQGWSLENAIPMENGVLIKDVTADELGIYQFKVLPQNTSWDNALGIYQINAECSSESVVQGDNDNIKVVINEPGQIKVEVVNGQLCVTGNFVDMDNAHYYIIGNMNNWSQDNAYPMVNDEIVMNLAASVYEFKVVPASFEWAQALTYADINAECSSEGIEEGDQGNLRITLAQDGEVTVKVVEGQLCVTGDFGGDVVVTVWNVVGDEALFGENWNINSATTIMTLGEDGKYRYEIESVALIPGEYKWKIVGNHSWDVAQYPKPGDYIINIAEEGNYRIIFTLDLDANAGTAEVIKLEEPVEATYYLAGTFTNWGEGRLAFENGAVAVTLEQSEEAAAFKIIKTVGEQDTWYGNAGTMTEDNCTGWKFETTIEANAGLTLSKSGLYTFNLTLNEQGEIHISVVYPSGETGIEAIMNAENAPAKFIYNGQLFIRKAGRLFNAQGQLVR